jgi:hypothetical protein
MWQHEAPKYNGDLDVYVWQQYRTQPAFQYADILLLTPTKVMLSLKSSQILQDFASLRLNGSMLRVPSAPRQPWSPTGELHLSVLTVYKKMIRETSVFIEGSMREINAMVCPNTSSADMSRSSLISDFTKKVKGRNDPSASKIRYLVHLEDSCSLAKQGVNKAISSLARLSAAISAFQNESLVWDIGIPFPERTGSFRQDLVCFGRGLKNCEQEIKEHQKMG